MKQPAIQRKGQGISINVLVILALAVFSVFLVIGFLTGGFQFFAGSFGEITEGTSGLETARLKCDQFCTSYISAGSPSVNTFWENRLCNARDDVDLDGSGTVEDGETYSCQELITCRISCPSP